MKKLVFIAIMATSMTAFVGCGSTNKATVQDTKVEEVVQEETKQEDEAQETTQEETKQEDTGENSNQPPITYDMLSVESELMEPDSIGNVYFKGKYTNNSDKILVGLQYEILLKDSNEKVYYDCYDTVLPGETSPTFSGSGPSTQNTDDMQILSISVILRNDDGTETCVKHDSKTRVYEWNVRNN